ncbi:MAG: molecular chaperone SurA [Pseudomonadales bacterium]|jgi:peptidyl-prolyl cis-trans isomerase SurA|nr:molecular chaperone SurA [Pseudomonadales bacterium]MCK5791326.1 peptidylprolyl isomerase [Ketobacter sp.]RLT87559.1 MAG: molecular chaperone SurA [Ketobacter sp. GenoA1]TNC91048.1 MAG: molecular chaperone SurA [Alcanivorax sp.]HAG95702.1 molecular chaperone SurA [Gammaproteobacteria bacterium]|tara:strand:- start:10366 stop:11664 length:1299 start_codon:yes stop_codon:yes gene_type:complete
MILLTRTYHRVTLHSLLAALLMLAAGLHAEPRELDRVVAVVDDDIIMETELLERTASIRARMRDQQTQLPPTDVLLEQVLERMIVESIELQMAEKAGIRVSDNQLNETLANIARQNNMTTEAFRETVLSEGMSWPALRDQIRRELTVNQLRQRRVGGRIQITDQDVDNFLNSEVAKTNLAPDYRLGHILIAIDNQTPPQVAEETAMMVYQKLQDGADFAALAVRYSSGDAALSGGDLGWRKAAQLPTLFSDTVLDMGAGDVSAPIRSASGYHIIKVLELRGGTEQIVQQTKARHILVKPNEIRSETETRTLIEDIYRQLQQDPDQFETLAKTYSDDPGSALQGGSLGWVNPGTMVPEFEQQMQAAQIGEISQPFRSDFGWHILQVEERRSQDMSEEFRRSRARQMLQKRRFDEELDGWLREIRQNAYVEIKL